MRHVYLTTLPLVLAASLALTTVWAQDAASPSSTSAASSSGTGHSAVETLRPGCGEAFLPSDLELITSVESSDMKEVHLHGQYRIGHDDFVASLGGLTRNLTLMYKQETEFRMSLFPDDASKLHLALYKTGGAAGDELVTRSRHGGLQIERMIFAVLKPNVRYNVVVVYSLGYKVSTRCPKVTMELAAQPKKLASHFSDACDDANEVLVIPPIHPSDLDKPKYYYEHNTEPKFTAVGSSAGKSQDEKQSSFGVIARYPVTVPHIPGHHGKWKFRTMLHANFIDGGDIAAVLTMGNDTTIEPTPERCSDGSVVQCFYGTRTTQNVFVLQQSLWSGVAGRDGQYVLWLVLRKAERALERTCAPFQIMVQLLPLKEDETFINCDIDALPPSMNLPGLYNNATGVLRYNAPVLVNVSQRSQRTSIVTKKKRSLLRAWLGNHETVDVDIVLYHKDRIVATSMAYKGPEGVVYELEEGEEYQLGLLVLSGFRRYTSTDHDYYEFCDSVELQVHVFPISSGETSDDACSATRAPQIEIQNSLNKTGEASFGLSDLRVAPYSFTTDVNKKAWPQQRLIENGIRFYLAKTTYFFALVSADTYGGTPQLVLTMDGSRQKLYSKTRTVGQEIYAELEAGWYKLDVLTPYVQRDTTWAEISGAIPKCIRYNFKLRMSRKTACLNPLRLPSELSETTHGHHHLFDEYLVPSSGTHLTTIKQKVGSTLHLKTTWSDAPVSFKLYEGDAQDMSESTLVTKSHSIHDYSPNSEIFANLKSDQYYTIAFDFDLSVGTPSSCKTFLMQLSLIPTPAATQQECKATQGQISLGQFSTPLDIVGIDTYKGSETPADRTPIVLSFSVNKTVHFRMLTDHDFTTHAMSIALCPCKTPSNCLHECVGGEMYFNGNEVPRRTLQPGDYSIEFRPWRYGLGSVGRDLEAECAFIATRIVIASIEARPAPAMCPTSMQYLPKSLDKVGMLSSHYGSEAHFFMHVKVNQKHYSDASSFTLGSKSIVRVFAPVTGINGAMAITSRDKSKIFGVASLGHALYVQLEPGAYTVSITFNMKWSHLDPSTCEYVPVEFAVLRSANLEAVARAPPGSDTSECKSQHAFPKAMMSHGHDTIYRHVKTGFGMKHVINFTITGSNAEVDVDIRANFLAGGLAAMIVGQVLSPSEGMQRLVYLFHHYSDRAILNRQLPPGDFQLHVVDPVTMYKSAYPTVSCTPLSLHIRQWGGGAPPPPPVTVPNPTPGAPPVTVPGTPPPSVRPHLECKYSEYDVLPDELDRPEDSSSQWYSVGGRHFEIPYAKGELSTTTLEGHTQMSVTVEMAVTVFAGDFVRVWAHTDAAVSGMRVKLVPDTDENDSTHHKTYTALQFGARTRTLAVKPRVGGESRDYTVEITFYFTKAPEYLTDFSDCYSKMRMTSYELYAAVSPAQHVFARAQCPTEAPQPEDDSTEDGPWARSGSDDGSDAGPADQPNGFTGTYPTLEKKIVLSKPFAVHGKQCHFTRHDCRMQVPKNWKNERTGPHMESMPFMAHTTCLWNTTVVVPEGSQGVFLSFEVKYNLLLSNMRSQLAFANGTLFKAHRGGPTSTRDEEYNAWTAIHGWGVPPGEYVLTLAQSFAESAKRIRRLAEVCVPFSVDLNFGGSQLGPDASNNVPSETGPGIVEVGPDSTNKLDPSVPVGLVLRTNTELDVEHRPDGKFPLYIVDNVTRARVQPSGWVYSSLTKVTIHYRPYALKWNWPYHVVVDASALKAKEDISAGFTDMSGPRPHYRTAPCSCFEGVCAVGGECACHESEATCDSCPEGTQLSAKRKRVGPHGSYPHRFVRVCEPLGETPAPPSPPSPDDNGGDDTPAPWPTNDDDPTPVPPPSSPSDVSPPSVPASSGRPPLKMMRVLMSAACLTLFAAFAIYRLQAYASRRQRRANFNNPFRRVAQDDDDDDEVDNAFDVPDNTGASSASPQRSSPARNRNAAPSFSRGAVDDDDDADENQAIV